jgi:hypothetical protein
MVQAAVLSRIAEVSCPLASQIMALIEGSQSRPTSLVIWPPEKSARMA